MRTLALAATVFVLAAGAAHAQVVSESAARSQLASLIDDVPAASTDFDDLDSTGLGVDAIKVIPSDTPGTYLGVYHVENPDGEYDVRVATSTNLLNWADPTRLAANASQATIAALPNGAYLVAYEKTRLLNPNVSHIVLRVYADQQLLLLGIPAGEYSVPNTLSAEHEGTPSINSVAFGPTSPLLGGLPLADLGPSSITVGFHYDVASLGVDREAQGTLTDFDSWSAAPYAPLNDAFGSARGNVGGRDELSFLGWPFTVVEAQSVKNDFASWRVYLYDDTGGSVTPLTPHTPGGSVAFGNPKVTVLTDPAGQRALVVSLFVFSQGAGVQASGATEAGSLVYYREL
ncbi:MAG TPA: hypothetical protein VHX88_19390 [Solirubrobacteraceae bacterium]|nr:hypothetical protein [Solirubrobacteraceae bacterium]